MGKGITRDTLKHNYHMIALAIKYVGLCVSVPTMQVHVKELYKYMNVPCPSCLFAIIDMDACKSELLISYEIMFAPIVVLRCYK